VSDQYRHCTTVTPVHTLYISHTSTHIVHHLLHRTQRGWRTSWNLTDVSPRNPWTLWVRDFREKSLSVYFQIDLTRVAVTCTLCGIAPEGYLYLRFPYAKITVVVLTDSDTSRPHLAPNRTVSCAAPLSYLYVVIPGNCCSHFAWLRHGLRLLSTCSRRM